MNDLPCILTIHLTDDENYVPVQKVVFSDCDTGEVFTELFLCDGVSFSYEVKHLGDSDVR